MSGGGGGKKKKGGAGGKKVNGAKGNSNSEPWTHEQQVLIEAGLVAFPYTVKKRWLSIAKTIEGRNPRECRERAEEMCFGNIQRATPIVASPRATTPLATTPLADPALEGGAQAVVEWTPAQMKALESALQEFPASLPAKERWKAIGNAVEGKKAKECLARFKEIRAQLLATSS